ncbi:hypothetical protein NQ314_017110 [Rhamnusium bicolor]|uniref:Retrovirus-related Pol polyprotein from transposon TNT 1-94-like beta-barrel domain-containing protein n=1 Tax=Rhamnusium bicolor TaxID=1586634 RepID=A0AAV8WV58_9CUCU|nr:hypothetical protein NQ314_017110 [Rhamnusium bicolor]
MISFYSSLTCAYAKLKTGSNGAIRAAYFWDPELCSGMREYFKTTDWYVDSGASIHLTARKEWLQNERTPDLPEIVVANKTKISVESAGDVQLKTVVDNLEHNVLLKKVQFVPELTTNLLSVCQLISNGNKVCFDENE